MARLAELIRARQPVVALTGAGISVPSGIPDFRSPGSGLWENVDPMEVAHIDAWRADPERFWHFYGNRFQTLEDKGPNGAHAALVELERRGKLDGIVTQNIDRLHRRAVPSVRRRLRSARVSRRMARRSARRALRSPMADTASSPSGVRASHRQATPVAAPPASVPRRP